MDLEKNTGTYLGLSTHDFAVVFVVVVFGPMPCIINLYFSWFIIMLASYSFYLKYGILKFLKFFLI